MGRSFILKIPLVFLLTGLLVVYQNCSPMEANVDDNGQFASANEETFQAVKAII